MILGRKNLGKILNVLKSLLICPYLNKRINLVHNYTKNVISLLCDTYKVYARLLNNRIITIAETHLSDYQAGFRSGRFSIDQLLIAKQILSKAGEYNTGIYQIFIDFCEVYQDYLKNCINFTYQLNC